VDGGQKETNVRIEVIAAMIVHALMLKEFSPASNACSCLSL
jgi:hypothetical protein